MRSMMPLFFIAIFFTGFGGLTAHAVPESPSATATLTHRASRPGQPLELIVTVREAAHPSVLVPSSLAGLKFHPLHKPELLSIEGKNVWLFRYRVTPFEVGDYEIPPFEVIDGDYSSKTQPLFLHVSRSGRLPQLSAKELSLGVNLPEPLSEEVLKAAPPPPLKPEPTPTPPDVRPLSARAASTCWKELKAFWNYPGK